MSNTKLIAVSGAVTLACVGYFAYGMMNSVASIDAPSNVVEVSSRDQAMNGAMSDARANVNDFYVLLKAGTVGTYMVKYPLGEANAVEHVWMKVERVTKSEFVGVLDSDPVYSNELSPGDPVRVARGAISDWMVQTSKGIHGARTIRASLDTLPAAEAAAMRQQLLD